MLLVNLPWLIKRTGMGKLWSISLWVRKEAGSCDTYGHYPYGSEREGGSGRDTYGHYPLGS
ncbi:hypothetical protein J27TS7_12210 [Paenibacillus dendritiformis]|nr:hypothetical protein J27TS7_12210 [Paenibacillus dendritiformis]